MNVVITVGLINFTFRLNEVPRDQPVNVNFDLESVPAQTEVITKPEKMKPFPDPTVPEKPTKAPRIPSYLRPDAPMEEEQNAQITQTDKHGKSFKFGDLAKKLGVTVRFVRHTLAWNQKALSLTEIENLIRTKKQAEDDCPTPFYKITVPDEQNSGQRPLDDRSGRTIKSAELAKKLGVSATFVDWITSPIVIQRYWIEKRPNIGAEMTVEETTELVLKAKKEEDAYFENETCVSIV